MDSSVVGGDTVMQQIVAVVDIRHPLVDDDVLAPFQRALAEVAP
jgi:hypothetical protein